MIGPITSWRTELFVQNARYLDKDAASALSFFMPLLGETDTETSQAAYMLLHTRYPRNPRTAKTPFWF
jgi:hypothetical protein